MATETDPRVTMALERTLLAWVRTSLALMGFGFVVARLGLLLRELGATAAVPRPGVSRWIGVGMVALGGLVQLAALVQYAHRVEALRSGRPILPRLISPALVVGVLLIATAIGMALYLVTVT